MTDSRRGARCRIRTRTCRSRRSCLSARLFSDVVDERVRGSTHGCTRAVDRDADLHVMPPSWLSPRVILAAAQRAPPRAGAANGYSWSCWERYSRGRPGGCLLLRLQPVDVLLLETGSRSSSRVPLSHARRSGRCPVEALDGRVLELKIDIELLGNRLATCTGNRRCSWARPEVEDPLDQPLGVLHLVDRLIAAVRASGGSPSSRTLAWMSTGDRRQLGGQHVVQQSMMSASPRMGHNYVTTLRPGGSGGGVGRRRRRAPGARSAAGRSRVAAQAHCRVAAGGNLFDRRRPCSISRRTRRSATP